MMPAPGTPLGAGPRPAPALARGACRAGWRAARAPWLAPHPRARALSLAGATGASLAEHAGRLTPAAAAEAPPPAAAYVHLPFCVWPGPPTASTFVVGKLLTLFNVWCLRWVDATRPEVRHWLWPGKRRCYYCDFPVSVVGSRAAASEGVLDGMARYVDHLCREIEATSTFRSGQVPRSCL